MTVPLADIRALNYGQHVRVYVIPMGAEAEPGSEGGPDSSLPMEVFEGMVWGTDCMTPWEPNLHRAEHWYLTIEQGEHVQDIFRRKMLRCDLIEEIEVVG